MAAEAKIAELKNHLSGYLRSVRRGQEIVIKDRETPVARLVPYGDVRPRLTVVPATRSLARAEQLLRRLKKPRKLKLEDLEKALKQERRERSLDWLA